MRRWFLLHLSPVSKVQPDQGIQSPWPFRVSPVWVPVREPEHVTCSSFNCVSFSLQSPHQLPNAISSGLWSTHISASKISLPQFLLVKSWLTSNKCHWPSPPSSAPAGGMLDTMVLPMPNKISYCRFKIISNSFSSCFFPTHTFHNYPTLQYTGIFLIHPSLKKNSIFSLSFCTGGSWQNLKALSPLSQFKSIFDEHWHIQTQCNSLSLRHSNIPACNVESHSPGHPKPHGFCAPAFITSFLHLSLALETCLRKLPLSPGWHSNVYFHRQSREVPPNHLFLFQTHLSAERENGSLVCDKECSEMALLSGAVLQSRNGDELEFNYIMRNCFN